MACDGCKLVEPISDDVRGGRAPRSIQRQGILTIIMGRLRTVLSNGLTTGSCTRPGRSPSGRTLPVGSFKETTKVRVSAHNEEQGW